MKERRSILPVRPSRRVSQSNGKREKKERLNLVPDTSGAMMRNELAALLLHGLDRVVQKEIYEDGVDARDMQFVDAVLLRPFLRRKLFLVDFLGPVRVAVRLR